MVYLYFIRPFLVLDPGFVEVFVHIRSSTFISDLDTEQITCFSLGIKKHIVCRELLIHFLGLFTFVA